MSSKSKDKIEEQMKEAQKKLKTNTQVVQSIQNVCHVSHDKNQVKNHLSHDKNHLSQDKNQMSQDKNHLSQDKNHLSQDKNTQSVKLR